MIADLHFSVELEGRRSDSVNCTIKQTAGAGVYDPIEVSAPHGYDGPWNQVQFAEVAEKYYRSQVGSSGAAIRIGPTARYVRMADNVFESTQSYVIDVTPTNPKGGW